MPTLSSSPTRKWRIRLDDHRTVDIGQPGASDFTIHQDPHRLLRYLLRHGGVTPQEYQAWKHRSPRDVLAFARTKTTSSREDWTDPTSRGYWARWLLWNEPSLEASWRDAVRRCKTRTPRQCGGTPRRARSPSPRRPRGACAGSTCPSSDRRATRKSASRSTLHAKARRRRG